MVKLFGLMMLAFISICFIAAFLGYNAVAVTCFSLAALSGLAMATSL